MRLWRWSIVLLLGAAVAFGGRLSFQEHAAEQESLARVHPRMRASWLRERGIEDPYYTAVRRPDSGQGLVEVGRWSYGPSYDVDGRVTASETLVALARGSGVSLLRFSRQDSLSIELLSDINAEGLMCRVKVVDTLLYVGSRKGLEIYDIADEQSPLRLSWTPTPLNDFALQDSLVYTISGDDLFRIYNVSNPASPVFRGACAESGDLVSVAGNAAFVGGRWGLYVLDVANPTSPHRIGSWGSDIEQVEARSHLCYVTTAGVEPGDITFHILDVAVPSLPYQIGSLDSAGGNDVFLVDTLVYGAGENDFNKLTIISIADSTRPRLVGSAATRGWSYGIWASGLAQESFVGCHWEGLQIYNARNTSSPVCDTFLLGCDQSVDIYIDNDRAYVANEMAGLKILDIRDPTRPKTIGAYDTTWQRPFTSSVIARDSFAFVDWWDRPSLRVLDVSDPAQPMTVGGCDVTNTPQDMVIRDSSVYVAEVARFQVVNVARPRQPVLVGSCVAGDATHASLCIHETLAYVGNFVGNVINVQDPASPQVVGQFGRGGSISVRDTFAFMSSGGIIVFSVADPSQPRLLDSLSVGSNTSWVEAVGPLLYTGHPDGLRVVDASDVHNMRVLGHATAPYGVGRLSYLSPYIYAAGGEAGLSIYESTQVAVSEATKGGVPRGLSVRPNPATTNAVLSGFCESPAAVIVLDIAGRVARCATRRLANGDVVLHLASMQPGVYFVEERTGATTARVKLVRR
jgi:hypothetical protein